MGATEAIARASDRVDAFAATLDDSERDRSLSHRAVDLLHDTEVTRIMTPAAYGGHQATIRDLVEAERVIAHGSPAASWVLMVCAAHTFIVGRMPGAGQDDVFATDPGMLIPGVPSPRGTAMVSAGGYTISGRWPYASGADHGDWVLLGCQGVRNEAGESCPSLLVVVPKDQVILDDTWFTLGMRGTGSKDVVVPDVEIPPHYAVHMGHAQAGTVPDVDLPLYRLPIRPSLATMLLGSIVGMAERGLDLFVDQARTRIDAYTGQQKAEAAGTQRRAAEASSEIACAWSLTQQNCDLLDAAMERDEPMVLEDRAQVRWNAAYASELCRRASERLFGGAGAGATFDENILQSVFRDLSTATHHAMLDFDNNVELQGKAMLGVEQPEAAV